MTGDDRDSIRAVRDAFVAADLANDAAAMTSLLADDVVILHPQCGVITGKEAASRFMHEVLGEVNARFVKYARYSPLEFNGCGGCVFERGEFEQELRPRGGGEVERQRGQYLWLFAKTDAGAWRIARIAGAFVTGEPTADC